MILPIYLYGSETLRKENLEADINDREGLARLLADMEETLKVADGCGLAAPQVTYIMHALAENGFGVGTDATTIEEATEEIFRAYQKKIGK